MTGTVSTSQCFLWPYITSVATIHPMTSISFTSGEIMQIQEVLQEKADRYYSEEAHQLGLYYEKMAQQFDSVLNKLQTLPGEQRVANLALLMP